MAGYILIELLCLFVCIEDNFPVNNFSVMSGCNNNFLGINQYSSKLRSMTGAAGIYSLMMANLAMLHGQPNFVIHDIA